MARTASSYSDPVLVEQPDVLQEQNVVLRELTEWSSKALSSSPYRLPCSFM
jgi:hypothetical protein